VGVIANFGLKGVMVVLLAPVICIHAFLISLISMVMVGEVAVLSDPCNCISIPSIDFSVLLSFKHFFLCPSLMFLSSVVIVHEKYSLELTD
jgi:hypothetical protein